MVDMGKGAFLRWIENSYLRTHIQGTGVEIGALWRKFEVSSHTKVWYVDRLSSDELGQHYSEVGTRIIRPDVVADAECLPFRNLNFIIASHVLEHLPFPLRAMRSWYDRLSPGGCLLLKIPDKRFTFDRNRQRTSLEHLIDEYKHPDSIDIRAHYADWVSGVNGRRLAQQEFKQELERLMTQNYSIHYHVWTDCDLKEIIDYTRTAWRLDWQPVVFWNAHFFRKETVTLLRKGGANA
jgi:SAM-dependent methyltransferase